MPIYVNKQLIPSFNFSGGECHPKIPTELISEKTKIIAFLHSSDDIMCLLLAVDAIRRIKADSAIHLSIPYVPYARQDRVCNEGEALSICVMAKLINQLNCASVSIYDPHSDVTPALLERCKVITQAQIIAKSNLGQMIQKQNLQLVSPDAGAEKKTSALAKMLSVDGKGVSVVYATKKRDTMTGHITESHVHGDVKGQNLMIVDDICDGGRTFIELAKVLKAEGAQDIYLYVTHGIFSKGLDELKQHFKKVFCYHTMLKNEQIDQNFLSLVGCQG